MKRPRAPAGATEVLTTPPPPPRTAQRDYTLQWTLGRCPSCNNACDTLARVVSADDVGVVCHRCARFRSKPVDAQRLRSMTAANDAASMFVLPKQLDAETLAILAEGKVVHCCLAAKNLALVPPAAVDAMQTIVLTNFEAKYFAGIVLFEHLQKLDLTTSTVASASLTRLQHLSQLRILVLEGCGNITDAGLQYLAHLTRLQELDLRFCRKITDAAQRSRR